MANFETKKNTRPSVDLFSKLKKIVFNKIHSKFNKYYLDKVQAKYNKIFELYGLGMHYNKRI